MIRKLVVAVILLALGGALTYYGLSHHIVQTADGMISVPKAQLAVEDTYADIREWDLSEFEAHPALVRALAADGHGDLLPEQAARKRGDLLKGVVEDVLSRDAGD